ncbi:hypothetical protein LA080_015741 [Diaporthe eres]|nr:hypothetical protein LA080_015741 [Diaporthe eres]
MAPLFSAPAHGPLFSGSKLFNSSASSNNHRSAGLNDNGPSNFKLPSDTSSTTDSSSTSDDTVIASFKYRNSHACATVPDHQSTGPSGANVEGLREAVRMLEGRTEVLECRTELLEGEIEQLQKQHRPPRNGKGLAELVAAFFQWMGAVFLWLMGVMPSQPDSEPRRRIQGQGTWGDEE